MGHLELYHLSVFVIVLLCWLAFAAVFIFRKRPVQSLAHKRNNSFIAGIILQGAGYFFVWTFRRQLFTHIIEIPLVAEILLALLTIILGVTSFLFLWSAIRVLGTHWSVAARTVEGHKLITTGPYAVVRHPIYTGLLGMLIATGLSLSQWEGLAAGVIFFVIGTQLRIKSEEQLLRETFGEEFERYTKHVPSFIPFTHI
jgi:protein-S-isoprenylcysteine O-methyltransferase Ste14